MHKKVSILVVMQWNKLIRERRKSIGVTQEQLADVADISLSYLKLIEQGKTNPTLQVIEKILDCLGMELAVNLKTSLLPYTE